MFPLGTVLFPYGVLPLHVFEARYLKMVSEALEDDGTFGVVLIERGQEVGRGGEHRFNVGCVARIVRAGRIAEARLAIVTIGVHRLRVEEWMPDDPYPLARVVDLADGPAGEDLVERIAEAHRRYRTLMALASELGADVGVGELDLPDDPRTAAWTMCGAAPIEQLDRQRLLEIDDPGDRLRALSAALDDRVEMLRSRLGGA